MYSVWFYDSEGYTRYFTSADSANKAMQIAERLHELFGVEAWAEQD